MGPIDRTDRICIVGAGSSGLAAAKNLREKGFAVDVLEREDDLGGNWNYGKPNARVYRSTHMITSKKCTQFSDFPMPREFPDYPHHSQVLAYLRAYSAHFNLAPCIEYRTPIARIEACTDGMAWDVTLANEVRRYGTIVIANGHNWSPKWPKYPGEFTGQMMHSAQYRTPDVLAGKRVLVIGGGNSGCDLAVESSQNAVATYHSTRRGYHYIPKYLFGRPTDTLGDKLLKLRLPLALRRSIIGAALKWIVGAPEKHGLPKPDHRLYETHPIHNSLLAYYVRHGDIKPKPDIERLDGNRVHFVDGTSTDVDVIVCATGYHIVFPFIDKEYLNWHDGRPRLYKNVFHPDRDNLFVVGLIQPDSGQFILVDWQTRAVAAYLTALQANPAAAQRLRQRKRRVGEDLGSGIQYKESSRHYVQVEHWSYREGLERLVAELSASARRAA